MDQPINTPNGMSRRALLTATAGLAGAPLFAASGSELKISIFSKHLRFLEGEALVASAAEIGFDGLDLAVRKGGHIEPNRVIEELPKLAAICQAHRVELPMITTDIIDVNTPYAEDILRAMHQLRIRYYRWGGFKYDYSKPMAPQLEAFRPRVAQLASLNKKYGVTAMYHTHSGVGVVGAAIWDMHIILKDLIQMLSQSITISGTQPSKGDTEAGLTASTLASRIYVESQ